MSTLSTDLPPPIPFPQSWPIYRLVEILRQQMPHLARRYQVAALGVFGSYVRNEQSPESDLDVLVVIHDLSQHSLLTIAALENTLSDMLDVPVDLALRDALKPALREDILDEVVWV